MQTDKLVTARDVADQLGVRVATVYAWADVGTLPSYRVGRLLRFSKTDIDAWLRSRLRARAEAAQGSEQPSESAS